VLYCPAAQSMHAEAPAASEYFPLAQSMQEVAPADEYLPAAQSWHKLDDPFFPAGQLLHCDWDVAVFPSAQLLQVRPDDVWPLLQHISLSHEHLSPAQLQSLDWHTEFLHEWQPDQLRGCNRSASLVPEQAASGQRQQAGVRCKPQCKSAYRHVPSVVPPQPPGRCDTPGWGTTAIPKKMNSAPRTRRDPRGGGARAGRGVVGG
jgi:hypothetical protein